MTQNETTETRDTKVRRVKAKNRKTEFLTLRFSPAEVRDISLEASKAKKTDASYIRHCLEFTKTVYPMFEALSARQAATERRQDSFERELSARMREWGSRLSEEIADALSDARIGGIIVDTIETAVPKAIDETMVRLRARREKGETRSSRS